ncbi:hypothetical protein D3C73_1573520 [compost metagenome]
MAGDMKITIGTARQNATIQLFTQWDTKSAVPLFTRVRTKDITNEVNPPIRKPNNTCVSLFFIDKLSLPLNKTRSSLTGRS